MKIAILIQTLIILALTHPTFAEPIQNQMKQDKPATERIVFIDYKEDLAVLTTSNNKVIFGKIKRFPSGQLKISFQ